jgi:hypothetical protein
MATRSEPRAGSRPGGLALLTGQLPVADRHQGSSQKLG